MAYLLLPALLLLSLRSWAQAPNPPHSATTPPAAAEQGSSSARQAPNSDAPANGFVDQGWGYEHAAQPELLDKQGGFLRFRVGIDAAGRIASVEKIDGNMSGKQTHHYQQLIRE